MAYDDHQPYYKNKNNFDQQSNNTQPNINIASTSGIFATNTTKEGWCLKKGPNSYNKWKKRYIQLSMKKQLNYYTDESMVVKKGTIYLNDLTIHHVKRSSKSADSKHHGFCVITTNRTYQFCVTSSSDRDHWIQKIREIIDDTWNAHKITSPSISYSNTNAMNNFKKPVSTAINPSFKQNHNNKYNNNAYNDDILLDSDNDNDDDDDNNKDDLFGMNHSTPGGPSTNNNIKSKYNRNAMNNNGSTTMLTQQQAQQKIQILEQKNDALLDQALQTTYDTQALAADTATVLDAQRGQLINIDKTLHQTNENLNKTEGILDGMKSWSGMIKRKFKKNKDPLPNAYQSPVDNKSVIQRNKYKKYDNDNNNNVNNSNNSNNNNPQLSAYAAVDNAQDAKLDELLKGVRALNQVGMDINQELEEQDVILQNINDKMDVVAPRIQQQNKTMKHITGK